MEFKRPYVIAGPCSVESRRQLAAAVAALKSLPQVAMVRCGVWKPRTRPGGFDGLGEEALRWMAEMKRTDARLRFCCEVARPEHVEMALSYGIDAVWVGARTTANPFMVQELSEALRGTALPVWVKNAPSPDVRLWVGAIERLRGVGLTDVGAIHRGFDVFKNEGFRNAPLWEVPIELRRAMPEVPILCDPSHIAGCREPLQMLSQTAMDLGFDGLMVEAHPWPQEALTDAGQQLAPEALQHLLEGLSMPQTDTAVADDQLRLLREQIDTVDRQMLQLYAARLDLSRQIAQVKAQAHLAVFQPKRWDALLRQRLEAARSLGLDPDFVKEVFEKIHAESVRVQEQELHPAKEPF